MKKDLRITFLSLMNKGLRKKGEVSTEDSNKSSVENKLYAVTTDLSEQDILDLLKMAQIHEILPLIYENIKTEPTFRKLDPSVRKEWQEKALQIAIREIVQTNEFLTLMLHMQEAGIQPLVLKGYVCRILWPEPYLRPSVDEDIYVCRADAAAAHNFLLSEGLFSDEENPQPDAADEISYHKVNSPTYIELHMSLFPHDSKAYGDCNRFFKNIYTDNVELQAEDVTLRTLCPTDHFLYLVLHAYKHFLHSGFGIRQIGDMVLFSEKYGKQNINDNIGCIDWDYIYECCVSQKIVKFTAALLKIGEKYFDFDTEKAGLSNIWMKEIADVDEADLLNDIMEAGLHGAADLNRIHSSNMTLEAVKEEKENERKQSSSFTRIMKTVFPSAKSLSGRYPYLKNRPYLLPAAWFARIFHYAKENLKSHEISSRKSLEIGRERTELLKKYGIID